jgi:hypothetical protein
MDAGVSTVVNGAAIIGLINGLGIFLPTLNSKAKIVIAVVVGAILPFIALNDPNLVRIISGVELGLATSGSYKLAQVLGVIKSS